MNYLTILTIAGIPTAVTGFCFWIVQRSLTRRDAIDDAKRAKRQKEVDDRMEKRDEMQFLLIQSINASIALSEATAKAVQRIPDAQCNGDMDGALEYALKVKHEQKEFLTKQSIKNTFGIPEE